MKLCTKQKREEEIVSNLLNTTDLENASSLIKALDHAYLFSRADLKGNIIYVNQKLCDVSGYTKEELLGAPHSILRHPNVDSKLFKSLWETIKKDLPMLIALLQPHVPDSESS